MPKPHPSSSGDRRRLLCLLQLPPPIHGVTMVNQTVATSALLAARFDLEILPLAHATSFEDLSRPSLRKLGGILETGVRLARTIVTRKPDAVYFTLTPGRSAFYRDCLFVAIMKLLGVPRIYHLHGKGIRAHLGATWRRQLYRWAFQDAWVIHLSERLVDELADLVPRERVLVVPNGIVPRAATIRGPRRHGLRLLFLSNMIESKGPLVLLEALGILRDRGIGFEATFAGAVHETAFLERFQAERRRRRLETQVHYIGPAYDADKQRLFDDHDVFVLPTSKDAFPLAVLEAMQAGLPVVTTHEGALPEIVEHGETGLVVPPRDPLALADGLATLIADPLLRRRMGVRSEARYAQRYTRAAFEQNLAAALATCTEAPASTAASSRSAGSAS